MTSNYPDANLGRRNADVEHVTICVDCQGRPATFWVRHHDDPDSTWPACWRCARGHVGLTAVAWAIDDHEET